MSRTFVDAVRGGNQNAGLPGGLHNVNGTGHHAVGRVQAMQEVLIHAAYLKSKGIIPSAASNVSVVGADFQDFRGVPGATYVMAHRAVGTVHIGNKNLADFIAPFSQYWTKGNPISEPTLLHHIVAPQARTDPLPRFSNYADTYIERFLNNPITLLFQRILKDQKANRPIEKAALVESAGRLAELIATAYGQAIVSLQENREDKGWVEMPSGIFAPAPEPDLDAVFDTMTVVSDRRPTEAGEAAQVFLVASYEYALHQATAATESMVSDTVAQLDDAPRGT